MIELEYGQVATGDYGTFQEFIVKLHSLCNFGCFYCYVYNMQDTSYLRNPKVMSPETAILVAQRIAEHALRYALPRIRIVLHGGEPLLAGMSLIRLLVTETRRRLQELTEGATELEVTMQSNGYLLDKPGVLEGLAELGVRVGVSLDGSKEHHDKVRRTLPTKAHPLGLPTYDRICANIATMQQKYPGMFSGILCVVDLAMNPVRTHESIVALRPPGIDYLLPLGNHDNPPPGLKSGGTPYADWLIAVWMRHLKYKYTLDLPRIRYFDQIMLQLIYGYSPSEVIGLPVRGALMIDTGGGYNHGDAGMSVADGLVEMRWRTTNLHLKSVKLGRGVRMGVRNCTIHDASITAMEINPRLGFKGSTADGPRLCATCTACPLRETCGGGYYVHRWKTGSAYWNPSVYCADLMKLIEFARQVDQIGQLFEVIRAHDNSPYNLIDALLRQRLQQLA